MVSESLDILVQIASAFHNHCMCPRHYRWLARFLIVNIIVEEYLHYRTIDWLPSESALSDNEDYFNDPNEF